MFLIENYKRNGFAITTLKEKETDTFIEIVPSCGAILHSFNVVINKAFINVIDSYESQQDFTENLTAKGFKSSKLSPFACRMKNARYNFNNEIFKVDKFSLGAHAIHGLLFDASFSSTNQHANQESAMLEIEHQYKGLNKGFPFHFDCIVTYELRKNNEVIVSTKIINQHHKAIPIQDGWHPYFTLGKKIDELDLQMQTSHHIIFDEGLIPTGEEIPYQEFSIFKKIGQHQFDDCFAVDMTKEQPHCILKNEEKKYQLEIWPDKNYPYLQIYTPPHRNSIAIENLSAPPDAFNNKKGLIILLPEESKNFSTAFKIKILN